MQYRARSKFGPKSANRKQIMDTQFLPSLPSLAVAGDAALLAIYCCEILAQYGLETILWWGKNVQKVSFHWFPLHLHYFKGMQV